MGQKTPPKTEGVKDKLFAVVIVNRGVGDNICYIDYNRLFKE